MGRNPELSISRAETGDAAIRASPPINDFSFAGSQTHHISAIGKQFVINLSKEDEAFYVAFPKAQRRRVRSKIDVRLLPVLGILYMFAQLDRANIGNAKIEGLKGDLCIKDGEYNFVLASFFFLYTLFGWLPARGDGGLPSFSCVYWTDEVEEIPSNGIFKGLKKTSTYIAGITVAFGLVTTCHGFAQNFAGLFTLRLLLGAAESGFYPAAVFLCSQWYRPHELALRFAFFTSVSASAGMVSGLLAAVIATMDGVGGFQDWRWIFIVEGSATVAMGLITPFILVDTPSQSEWWLSADEVRYLEIQAVIKNGGIKMEPRESSSWREFLAVVQNWRYWALSLMFHSGAACGYGLKFVIPSITKSLGYANSKAQLLNAVPYVFAIFSSLAVAMASDMLAKHSFFRHWRLHLHHHRPEYHHKPPVTSQAAQAHARSLYHCRHGLCSVRRLPNPLNRRQLVVKQHCDVQPEGHWAAIRICARKPGWLDRLAHI